MKVLIVGAGILLAATASPALANGGGGRGGGGGYEARGASFSQSFGQLGQWLKTFHPRFFDDSPGFSSRGRHFGWFRGRHWGWFKPHNPHWPHEPPASP